MGTICNEFSLEVVERLAREALEQWGYDCEVKVESEDILCITVFSRLAVELDSRQRKFRFCRTEDLTYGSSGRHRPNYYEWHEGLAKFSTESFWLTRGASVDVRGPQSLSESILTIVRRSKKREDDALRYVSNIEERRKQSKDWYVDNHKKVFSLCKTL